VTAALVPRAHSGKVVGVGAGVAEEPLEDVDDGLAEELGLAEGVTPALAVAVGVAVSSTTAPEPVLAASSTKG